MKRNFYTLALILLTGCTASNNIKAVKSDVIVQEQQMLEMEKRINTLDYERNAKLNNGKLDETTDSVTVTFIKRLKDSVNARLAFYKVIIADSSKAYKDKGYINAYLNSIKQNYAKELNNIIFLDDLFKASTFNRLNTAAFFAPGEYKLSGSSVNQASEVMNSIIAQAHDFSVKYADRKLKAMFVVLGYADEQEITQGTDLFNELAPAIGSDMPSRKQLNNELSNRRASSIKNILRDQYRKQFPASESYLFSSSFVATGKGEMIPPGKLENLQSIDERRRVVLIYWSVLPDLN
ncbi:MAG: hypothetical protein QM726_02455 [Chitinophagaceae bacterium]